MSKVKIGIIGTGVGIRTHWKAFNELDDAEVVAICGSSIERSEEFSLKYNIKKACFDYKELCDIQDVDLVCITSPNRFHYDAVEYAIKKEKHIICEKPVSDKVDEIRSLADLAKKYDKMFIVNHQLRFNPYMRKIKEIIRGGDLGKIYSVRFNQQGTGFANINAPWTWSFDGKEGGGVRLAMASHLTDLVQFWFGDRKILSLNGYLNPVTKERKDSSGELRKVMASTICTAGINFENELNVIYSINAGSYAESRFDVNIFGDKGELAFSLRDKLVMYLRENIGEKSFVGVNGVYLDEIENKVSIFSGSFRYCAALVIKAILSNDLMLVSDAASINDAQYNALLLNQIQESANCVNFEAIKKVYNIYV